MIKKKLKQNVNLSAIIDNTGNTQDIQQLKIDVAANTNNITTNTQNIASLQQDVANNTAEIGRFNQITTDLELKYNGLEPKVTQNTNDIAALQTKTDEIDPLKARVDTLEPKVTKNETDIAALDTVVKRDEIRIGLLEIFQTDTENTLQVLENQGNQLEQRVNQHTTDIANINTTLTNVPKLNTVNTFTQNQFIKGTTLSKFALRNDANQDPLSLETTTSGNQGVIKNNAGGTIRYENAAAPTNPTDCTNKQYVDGINTALTNRINTIETSLENGNIVNYVGNYDSATTYSIAQCVTFNDEWYVSKIDNNTGNQPDNSPTQWELLSAPTVDLAPYLTKTEAGQTYETIANVTALTARVTTNEQNIANKANQSDLNDLSTKVTANENAIDQIDQELTSFAKLGLDNTFTANNTFDNPVTINNAIGIKRNATDFSLVELNHQNGKFINFDFNQQSGDYKNYCTLKIRHKHKNANYTDLLMFECRPNGNDGVFITTPLGFIGFQNTHLKCGRAPTENASLTNKQYVDGMISVVEVNLSSGQQTTTTIANGAITLYHTTLTPANLQNADLTKLISCYVYHPNGNYQQNRMLNFTYTIQYNSTDATKNTILISGTPIGTFDQNYYNTLKARLVFRR